MPHDSAWVCDIHHTRDTVPGRLRWKRSGPPELLSHFARSELDQELTGGMRPTTAQRGHRRHLQAVDGRRDPRRRAAPATPDQPGDDRPSARGQPTQRLARRARRRRLSRLSTLTGYVAALGGDLEMEAVFPDETITVLREPATFPDARAGFADRTNRTRIEGTRLWRRVRRVCRAPTRTPACTRERQREQICGRPVLWLEFWSCLRLCRLPP
jgi:hypothetical protein